MRRLWIVGGLVAACGTTPEPMNAGANTADASVGVDAGGALDAGTAADVLPGDTAVDGVPAVPDAAVGGDGMTDASPAGNTLTVVIFRVPDNTPAGAGVYLTGDFNGWMPGDLAMRLTSGVHGTLTTQVRGLTPGQHLAFKFTRGAWATVEKADDGSDIANRTTVFDPSHPVVALFVQRWADLPAPATTRSGNVQTLPGVAIPQLATTRTVWVYLPPDYATDTRRYPVTYMFDAQNLFDARTSAYGQEWQVDEALEALHYQGILDGMIVVGVENSAQRGCEYNVFPADPHPACSAGTALGDQTVAFLVDTLKPRIDGQYRTRTDRLSTGVVGSSMGGSMAVRTGFLHPEVFSRVGALSPSYQNTLMATPGMPGFVQAQHPAQPFRLHQDVGSAEQIREIPASVLIHNMTAVHDAARTAGLPDTAQRALVVPGAVHNETAWAARISDVLAWLWAP